MSHLEIRIYRYPNPEIINEVCILFEEMPLFCKYKIMKKYLTVSDFLNDLDKDKYDQVQALRDVIVNANPNLSEYIKWNAPSYVYEGEHRITFNLVNKQQLVMIVIHMGATRVENKKAQPVLNDSSGLVIWNSNIRGTICFENLEQIIYRSEDISKLIESWLMLK